MTRNFLGTPSESEPAAAPGQPVAAATATSGVARPAPATAKDAFIGAFPAWDLVPAINFIRRVK